MPWPATQRATTRQVILDSAARLFALEGFEKVSIDSIMESAGLTRGASIVTSHPKRSFTPKRLEMPRTRGARYWNRLVKTVCSR